MNITTENSELFLVTTAIEETWPTNSPVSFLGEWCCLHRRRDQWTSMRGSVLPFHWDDREKLFSDFKYLQKFNEELLDDLVLSLNELHCTKHDRQYWKLLLSFWLNMVTVVLYDRWYSIQKATDETDLKTIVFPADNESLAANDTAHFYKMASSNSYWNHLLYRECFRSNKRLKKIENNDKKCIRELRLTTMRSPMTFHERLKLYVSKFFWTFKKNDRVMIFNSGLKFKDKTRLNAGFFQFPSLIDYLGREKSFSYSSEFRGWTLPDRELSDGFKAFARQLVPILMPRVFLEGYHEARANSMKCGLPLAPKVIFTSVSQYLDDKFKFWSGRQVEVGAKFFVGEHGGFAATKFSGSMSHDFLVSDKYLSTGWDLAEEPVVIPVGNFRMRFRGEAFNANRHGHVLITCGSMPQYIADIRSMALGPQTILNYRLVFDLVDGLTVEQKDLIKVRLHPSDESWNAKGRWLERHPTIKFASRRGHIHSLMKTCRVNIVTYRATVFIDSLMGNIPTLMFWDPLLWEVSESALPAFERLKEVGIFHSDPKTIVTHIQKYWDDMPAWWLSKPVQDARLKFLSDYSTPSLDALSNIATEIDDVINERKIKKKRL